MEKLQERADEFAATGCTEFRKWELLTWFNQERITKNIWRNINDHFLEKSDNREPLCIEISDKYIFFDETSTSKISDLI